MILLESLHFLKCLIILRQTTLISILTELTKNYMWLRNLILNKENVPKNQGKVKIKRTYINGIITKKREKKREK